MPKDNVNLEDVSQAVIEVKTAFEAFKDADQERTKELLTKGDVDVLLTEKIDRITEELDKKQVAIDELYTASQRAHITVDGKEVDKEELDRKAADWAEMATSTSSRKSRSAPDEFGYDDLESYKSAIGTYMRDGRENLSVEEQKSLSVGYDPDGGYVVSPDTSGRVVTRQFETSPMMNFASVQMITTESLEGLFDLDEADAGWVTEKGARSETDTPELARWSIPVHELYAQPRATQKILDDAAINIEQWLANKVADKLMRIKNAAWVNGDGVGKPRGFLSYPGGTTNPGQLVRYETGVDGGFAADPDGGDKLIEMVYGLKSNYHSNARFFMNRTTLGKVRLLKDNDSRYLWQPSLIAGQPSTLVGYPVANLEDMPNSTTTDALAIAFGDMAQAYQIVERMGIRILRDPYSAKPYILFYTTTRTGGDVVNFEALNLLEFTA